MFPGTQGATRPKPPSVLRRSLGNTNTTSTTKDIHSPPPPYQISPDSLNSVAPAGHPGLHKRNLSVCSVSSTSNMDASVTATAQLLGLELASRTPDPAEGSVDAEKERERDEAYVREKSREELEKLLLKAEAVIRARERELGVAAAVGKQLLEANLTLRQRHASIVSKTSPMPQMLSPIIIGTSTSTDALSPPMTPIMSPSVHQRHPGNTGSSRHSRRLSTTPAQLAILNKQNEELLSTLANIQDETTAADLEGKQKLRKLEKEIAGLRSELESSHQKNNELETKIDTVQAEQEHQRQRSKDIDLTSLSGSKATLKEEEEPNSLGSSFPNFAPLSTTPLKKAFERQAVGHSESEPRPKLVAFPSSEQVETQPSAEYLLLSRLLSKIEELEHTNRQILARHRETDSRLRNVTSRSDALQKVYATLEDEMENDMLHLDADDEFEEGLLSPQPGFSPGQYDSGGMHALGVVFEPPDESSFEREPSLRDRGSPVPSIHRTESGLTPMISSNSLRSKRSRKTLSPRLFDNTVEDSSSAYTSSHFRRDDPDSEEEPDFQGDSSLLAGKAFKSMSRLRPRASTTSMGSTKRKLRQKPSLDGRASTISLAPRKSIRSSASYQGLREQPTQINEMTLINTRGDTLWNEIKALADDDIEDIEAVDRTIDSILYEHTGRSSTSVQGDPPVGDEEEDYQEVARKENGAVAAIRQALDPRNAGKPLNEDEHILPVGSLEGSPGESFFLISHAVAARPTKWTATSPKSSPYLDAAARHRRRVEPADERKSNARADALYGPDGGSMTFGRRADALERLNEAAQDRTGPNTYAGSNRGDRQRDELGNDSRSGTLTRNGRKRRDDNQVQEGWGQTLLELWIILQAAIILLVFVYSMARKGPRAILDAAEVRRRPA